MPSTEVTAKLTMEEWQRLKWMTRTQARVMLKGKELSAAAWEEVMQRCRPDVESGYEMHLLAAKTRRRKIAAAWIAGASWNTLALKEGVAGGTVKAAAYRELPPAAQRTRLGVLVTYERLEVMWAVFEMRQHETTEMSIEALAHWLVENSRIEPGE